MESELKVTVTMPNNTISPKLLEPSLPGAWIADRPHIWQMNLLGVVKE